MPSSDGTGKPGPELNGQRRLRMRFAWRYSADGSSRLVWLRCGAPMPGSKLPVIPGIERCRLRPVQLRVRTMRSPVLVTQRPGFKFGGRPTGRENGVRLSSHSYRKNGGPTSWFEGQVDSDLVAVNKNFFDASRHELEIQTRCHAFGWR